MGAPYTGDPTGAVVASYANPADGTDKVNAASVTVAIRGLTDDVARLAAQGGQRRVRYGFLETNAAFGTPRNVSAYDVVYVSELTGASSSTVFMLAQPAAGDEGKELALVISAGTYGITLGVDITGEDHTLISLAAGGQATVRLLCTTDDHLVSPAYGPTQWLLQSWSVSDPADLTVVDWLGKSL